MLIGDISVKMSADIAELRAGFDQVKSKLDDMSKSVSASSRASSDAIEQVVQRIQRYMSVAVVLATTYKLSKEFLETADSLKLLGARLASATGSAAEGQRAFAGLVEDAKRLRVPINDAVDGFARIAASVRELGGTTEDARKLNEILLATAKVSGITGEEAAAAARQFAQALGSGVLQGDELRSILENNQELARQLAAGLGVSIGELRKLGSEGKLTADVVANALTGRLPEIQQKLKDVPLTTADGFTALRNEITLFVGALDKVTGTSGRVATGLMSMASAVGELRKEFEGDWISKISALNNAAALITAPGLGVARLNQAASARSSAYTSPGEADVEAANAAIQKSALGVAAAAKAAYADALKIQDDVLSKQQKVTKEFGEQMQTIAKAIDAQRKVVNSAPAGSTAAAEATQKIVDLEKLRSQAMGEVVKKIAEANAADARRSGVTKELTEQQRAYNSAMQDLGKLAENASADLAEMFQDEKFTKAERALLDLMNSDAWDKLDKAQKDRITDKAMEAAETERLTERIKELAEASGKYAADRAKDYDKWVADSAKAAESVDDLVAKLNAQATALRTNGGETNEQAQALRQLSEDLERGLIPSMEEYEKRVQRVNAAFANRDNAQLWVDANKHAIEQQKKDYDDLYRSVDNLTSQLWSAFADKSGNAFQKATDVLKNTLYAALYKLTVQPFVMNITAAISGQGGGGVSGAFGGLSSLFGDFGSTVSNFVADLDHGVGVVDSFMTALETGGTSILGVAGLIATAGTMLYSWLDSKKGGPKQGGFASVGDTGGISGTDDSGRRWFTPTGADAQLLKSVQGIQDQYAALLKALGGTGSAGIAVGYDTDPEGTAPNRAHVGVFSGGAQVYNAEYSDLGRDDATLQATLELESKRALLAALQASDLPEYLANILNSVDAASADSTAIDNILATAAAIKGVVDSFGPLGGVFTQFADSLTAMSPEDVQALASAFGGLSAMSQTMAYVAQNFTTAQQKLSISSGQLNSDFAALGLAVPSSHQAFLDLLSSFDLTTEEGRNMYAAVSALAPAFVAVKGSADDAAEAAITAATKLQELKDELSDFTSDNFLTDAQKQSAAVAAVQDMFASFTGLAGSALPKTHDGFLRLIGDLGLTTEQQLLLEKAFVRAYGTAQDYADALEAENQARQDALDYFNQNFQPPTVTIANYWGAVQAAWTQYGGEALRQGLGDHIPTATAAFYQFVTSIDRTTEAGEAFYQAMLKLAPTIVGLNSEIANLDDSADAAAEAAARAAAAYQASAEAAGQVATIYSGVIGAIQQIVSQSGGDFGEKLALQIRLIPEQIRNVQAQLEAEIARGGYYSPLAQQLRAILTQLGQLNQQSVAQLARYTTLTAQYGAAKAEELVQLEAWYAEMKTALAGNSDALAALAQVFGDKWKAILEGTTEGTESELDRLRQSIRDFLKSLQTSDLSPLSPQEKFLEAQKQYLELLAKAQGGDTDALSKLPAAAQEYLKLAQTMYASGGEYSTIFQQVVDALQALADGKGRVGPHQTTLEAALPTSSPISSQDDIAALKAEVSMLRSEISALTGALVAGHEKVATAVKDTGAANTDKLVSALEPRR